MIYYMCELENDIFFKGGRQEKDILYLKHLQLVKICRSYISFIFPDVFDM